MWRDLEAEIGRERIEEGRERMGKGGERKSEREMEGKAPGSRYECLHSLLFPDYFLSLNKSSLSNAATMNSSSGALRHFSPHLKGFGIPLND